MLLISLRIITKDKGRLILQVLAISFALSMMLLLTGIFHGSIERDVKFVREIQADLFVFSKGTATYYQVSTPVAVDGLQQLRQLHAVDEVTPIYTMRMALERDGKVFSLFVSGYDPNDQRHGPWAISSGTRAIRENEIAIPSRLSSKLGLAVGDTVNLSGTKQAFTIGALVPEASSFGRHHSWITAETAQKLYPLPGYASFGLITLRKGSSPSSTIRAIEGKLPEVSIKTKSDQLQLARDFQADSFAPILNAMTLIAIVMGTLIVGVILQSSVHERRRELGVMLAIGFTPRSLVGLILMQSIALVLCGFLIATGLTFGISRLLIGLFEFPFLLNTASVLQSAVLALAIALLATTPSIRFISRVDPSEAFK